jgi:predicted enzyme related to lactoylglutathione lyase
MNSIGYFEIQSSNPEREIGFYENIFGWKFTRQDSVPIEYYQIETSTINGGLLKRPGQVPPSESGTNAYVCSIQVADFDKTSEEILRNGGQIALPKSSIPGRCWQGYFIDPDNNTFGVFEVDENAG